jgi:hypothetical protein
MEEQEFDNSEYSFRIAKGEIIEAVNLDQDNQGMIMEWIGRRDGLLGGFAAIPVPDGILVYQPDASEWENVDGHASLSWAFFVPKGHWLIKTLTPHQCLETDMTELLDMNWCEFRDGFEPEE